MTLSQRAIEAGKAAMEAKRADLQHLPLARIYDELATACLTAALAVDGVALVPTVATDKMICAALDDYDRRGGYLDRHGGQSYSDTWAAMIAAANDGEERPSPPEGKI